MWTIIILILLILTIIGIIKFAKTYTLLFTVLVIFIILIIFIRIIRKTKKAKKINNLYKKIQENTSILIGDTDKSTRLKMIQLLLEDLNELNTLGESVQNKINEIHRNFLSSIIKDCKITDEEKEVLKYLEKTFCLTTETIKNNRRIAYTTVYEWAIEDRKLTEKEENILRNIFLQLDINAEDVEEEQAFLKDLSLARQLSGKELNPIKTPFTLNKNEQCFFSINDTYLYKSRRKNYEYHREDNPILIGKLYITNQRIIINAPGEYSRSLISEIDMVSILEECNIDTYDYFLKLYFKRKNSTEYIKVSKPYLTKVILINYLNKARG